MRRGKERTGEEKGEGWGLDGRGGERRGGKKRKRNKMDLEGAFEGQSALGKWNYGGDM